MSREREREIKKFTSKRGNGENERKKCKLMDVSITIKKHSEKINIRHYSN